MPRNITINITFKGILLVLAALALIWVFTTFDKIFLILFLAILLAVAIDPLVDRLQANRIPRAVGIVIVYLLLIGILSAVLSLLIPVLATEFSQLGTNLPGLFERFLDLPRTLIAPYFPTVARSLSSANVSKTIGDQFGAVASNVGGYVVGFGKTLTTILISTFLILVVGFFLTADARFAPHLISRFFPPSYQPTAAELARDIGGRLGHWVRAQLLVGLFFGVTFGVGLAVMGVPYALSLGAVGAMLELIPYLGGAIVTAIAMIVALPISPLLALGVLVC